MAVSFKGDRKERVRSRDRVEREAEVLERRNGMKGKEEGNAQWKRKVKMDRGGGTGREDQVRYSKRKKGRRRGE